MSLEPTVPNVQSCTYCQNTVDRFGEMIECSNCGAYGDAFTGTMEPPPPAPYQ